jgi:hypothetical protein
MGSVIDTIACNRCGGEAYSEYYYNSGEEETSCMHCGYQYSGRYQRDENRKLVTKDGTDDYRFENLIWTEKIVQPYACYHLKFKDSPFTKCGSLDDEQEVEFFRAEVKDRKAEIEKAFLSRYDEEKKDVVREVVIG